MEKQASEKEKQDVDIALKTVTKEQLSTLSKSKIIELYMMEQDLRVQIMENKKLYTIEGRTVILKRMLFAPSTEKSQTKKGKPKTKKKTPPATDKKLLPSDRYPNAEIEDFTVEIDENELKCNQCQSQMVDSGLKDVSETLKVIPKKYIIERHHHIIYKCKCCSTLESTPRIPRIKPGSSYGDSMIIDVSLSKYNDLIPMERYSAIAAREGIPNLPPNSLIELTHYFSEFFTPAVDAIENEVTQAKVLFADETPHRMMEQVSKKNWYLWGFSTTTAAYFKCHASRSGDIAADFLKRSNCQYLMTDGYAGYSKGVKIANKDRQQSIVNIYCNSHSRRKFKQIEENSKAEFFIYCYKRIYFLEKYSDDPRPWQKFYFAVMKKRAEQLVASEIGRSSLSEACKYFLKYFDGLSLFLSSDTIPLDNNHQERLLRSPVVGRKVWYGNHSILGAVTAGKIFTVIESCKLNHINPRIYLEKIAERIHMKQKILTPFEAKRDFPQIFSPDLPLQKTN